MARTGLHGNGASGQAESPADPAVEHSVTGEDIAETPPTGGGRITVTLPDGTMLTLIGVPRLLIAGSGGTGTGSPRQA